MYYKKYGELPYINNSNNDLSRQQNNNNKQNDECNNDSSISNDKTLTTSIINGSSNNSTFTPIPRPTPQHSPTTTTTTTTANDNSNDNNHVMDLSMQSQSNNTDNVGIKLKTSPNIMNDIDIGISKRSIKIENNDSNQKSSKMFKTDNEQQQNSIIKTSPNQRNDLLTINIKPEKTSTAFLPSPFSSLANPFLPHHLMSPSLHHHHQQQQQQQQIKMPHHPIAIPATTPNGSTPTLSSSPSLGNFHSNFSSSMLKLPGYNNQHSSFHVPTKMENNEQNHHPHHHQQNLQNHLQHQFLQHATQQLLSGGGQSVFNEQLSSFLPPNLLNQPPRPPSTSQNSNNISLDETNEEDTEEYVPDSNEPPPVPINVLITKPTELMKSDSLAMFIRVWDRGANNSCSRTDLHFKYIPNCKYLLNKAKAEKLSRSNASTPTVKEEKVSFYF
jgi:hypothetical protein